MEELVRDLRQREGARAQFLAAWFELLSGNQRSAAETLGGVVEKYGDLKAPMCNAPTGVVGRFLKGMIYRHSGMYGLSRSTYEKSLALKGYEGAGVVRMMCRLYLAEAEWRCGSVEESVRQLRLARQEERPRAKDMAMLWKFYRDWASFLSESYVKGAVEAQRMLVGSDEAIDVCLPIVTNHLTVTGVIGEPIPGIFSDNPAILRKMLTAIGRNLSSDIDRSLALLFLGRLAADGAQRIAAYREAFESPGFLAPRAGHLLLRAMVSHGRDKDVSAVREEMRTRFPHFEVDGGR